MKQTSLTQNTSKGTIIINRTINRLIDRFHLSMKYIRLVEFITIDSVDQMYYNSLLSQHISLQIHEQVLNEEQFSTV